MLPYSTTNSTYRKQSAVLHGLSHFSTKPAILGGSILVSFILTVHWVYSLVSNGGDVSQVTAPNTSGGIMYSATPFSVPNVTYLNEVSVNNPYAAVNIPGAHFRDPYPMQTVNYFFSLAEKEVSSRNLDTCHDQLGRKFVEAYNSSRLVFCNGEDGSEVICFPVKDDRFTSWWPYPAAYCNSKKLQPDPTAPRRMFSQSCLVTGAGEKLTVEMGRERFLGSDGTFGGKVTDEDLDRIGACDSLLDNDRTLMIIGRQDQWNPFHVAEDLVTTVLDLLLTSMSFPDQVQDRIQLIFVDEFELARNHFSTLWDRVGAWAPRRTSLDPWLKGECFTGSVIHSIGAGASLLSAVGVGKSYNCASTLVWAASHYYRHLFGLLPPSPSIQSYEPINVLWLSRAKMDAHAVKVDDWSAWRDTRHIENELEMLNTIRAGITELCRNADCDFEDIKNFPESWDQKAVEGENRKIRFATIDPSVHALETQIAFVGQSTVLLSSHGGALGLSLFLPPGQSSVIEIQSTGATGNYHFHNMAAQMGNKYTRLLEERVVDVHRVWRAMEQELKERLTQ